jgi:hypothetical protein
MVKFWRRRVQPGPAHAQPAVPVDLVVWAGEVDVSRIKAEELPAEMQKMTPAERTAYVAKLRAERESLNGKLVLLSQKRADYIAKEEKRLAAAGTGDSFDTKVAEIIRSQAAKKN